MKLIDRIHIGGKETAIYYPFYSKDRYVDVIPDEKTYYQAVFGRLVRFLKEGRKIKFVSFEYLLPILYREREKLGIKFELGEFEEIIKKSPITNFTFDSFPVYCLVGLERPRFYPDDETFLLNFKDLNLLQKLSSLLSTFFDLPYSNYSIKGLVSSVENILNDPHLMFISVLNKLRKESDLIELERFASYEKLRDNFIFRVNCKKDPTELSYDSDYFHCQIYSMTIPSICMAIQMNNEYDEGDLKVTVNDYVDLVISTLEDEFRQVFEEYIVDTLYKISINYHDATLLLLMPKRITEKVIKLINETRKINPIKNLARVLEKFNFGWEGKVGELASKEVMLSI